MSRDPVLLGMYERGQDPYVAIGAGAGREARRKEREVGKRVALAALYGAKPSTLAHDLQLTVEAVELAIESYRAWFPRLWQWRDELLDGFYEGKEMRNPSGRRLVPETNAQVINYPCQSSVADIIKLAMVRLDQRLPADAHMVAQIHDELLVECPEDQAEVVATLMVEEMTRPLSELTVPLAAKVGIGRTWKDAVHGQP
jgi:DNA polymerase-1